MQYAWYAEIVDGPFENWKIHSQRRSESGALAENFFSLERIWVVGIRREENCSLSEEYNSTFSLVLILRFDRFKINTFGIWYCHVFQPCLAFNQDYDCTARFKPELRLSPKPKCKRFSPIMIMSTLPVYAFLGSICGLYFSNVGSL